MLAVRSHQVILALGLVALILLQSLAISIGLGLPLSMLAVVVACLGVLAIASWNGNLNDGGIWWVTLIAVAIPITYISTFVTRSTPAADVWLMLVAVVALRRFPSVLAELTVIRWLVALYVAHLAFGIVSTIASTVSWKAAVYQAAFNLKLPAMLFSGIAIGWNREREKTLRWVLLITTITTFTIVLFQLVLPAHYQAIATGSVQLHTPNPLLRGLTYRLNGPYIHSANLATNAAFCGVVFCIFYLTKLGSSLLNLSGMLIATSLLAFSGQQQEAIAYLLTVVIVGVMIKTKPSLGLIVKLLILGAIASAALFLLIGETQLAKLENEWGISASTRRIDSARPVFVRDGIEIANSAFPLGKGLGSYGSVGAQLFDRSLYTKLGYDSYWWYRQGLYLIDTYWPNIIAEGGWFGAMTLLAFLLTALLMVASRFWNEQDIGRKRLYGIATAGHLTVLLTSLTSPLYGDPSTSAWLLIWTGIALGTMCQRTRPAPNGVATNARLKQSSVALPMVESHT